MGVVSRAQLEESLSALRPHPPTAHLGSRAGLFGPSSASWQLGGDVAVFAGGGRAALLQLAHPMVAHAIAHHSTTRTDVAGRFHRTFHNIFAMTFGTLDDAQRAARRVHTVHARITGTIHTGSPAYPAGTPYSANDADALRWVHATLADTILVVRERMRGPIERALADRFIADQNQFAALFGIPRDLLPSSYAEHAHYMARMLAPDGPLFVTPPAREMAQFLFGQGRTSLGKLAEITTAALLPDHLVRAFALTAAPRRAAAAMSTFAALYRRLPRAATLLPAHAEALARLDGRPRPLFAAWGEKQLLGLAKRVAG